MKLLYTFLLLGSFTLSVKAQTDSFLLCNFRKLLPQEWEIEQKGNTFTITKPDSVWVKWYRGSVFQTQAYVNPCDSIKDYETQMRCLRSHDASYKKIKYSLHLKLEPKWTEEKIKKTQLHNDSLTRLWLATAQKFPIEINGKSYDVWDRYWISYNADSAEEKRKKFEDEKEFIRNQITELPWRTTKWQSIFFFTSRDFATPCTDEKILSIENDIIDLITRDTFDLGNIRYKSSNTKRKIKLIANSHLEIRNTSKKNCNKSVYFQLKKQQRYISAANPATLIVHINSVTGPGTETVSVIELPGVYPKKTIAVKWRVLSK